MNFSKLNTILNWSVRIFKIFGIPVSLHISILFFLWPLVSRQGSNLLYAFEYILLIVLSILLHELGHALTAKHFKLKDITIMLHGFGGYATSSGERDWKQSLAITLAGPGVTFLVGIICLLVGNAGLSSSDPQFGAYRQFGLIYSVGTINILLGIVNLVPMLPWDGGHALTAILNRKWPYVKALRAVGHLGMIIGPALLIYCLATKQDFLALFAFVGIVTSFSLLNQTGGIRFGEVFADRRNQKEILEQAKREQERKAKYLDEVRDRMNEREEKERLRKMFEVVDGDK